MMANNTENTFDAPLGDLVSVHRISDEFGQDKIRAIKLFTVILSFVALVLSVLAGLGIYDLLTEGRDRKDTVFLLIFLAVGFWILAATVFVGGLSSRAAGRSSQLKIYHNGFVLIQGKRFGGAKTDVCLWREVDNFSEATVKFPEEQGSLNLVDTFVGYKITKTDKTSIFVSANFEGVEEIGKFLRRTI